MEQDSASLPHGGLLAERSQPVPLPCGEVLSRLIDCALMRRQHHRGGAEYGAVTEAFWEVHAPLGGLSLAAAPGGRGTEERAGPPAASLWSREGRV